MKSSIISLLLLASISGCATKGVAPLMSASAGVAAAVSAPDRQLAAAAPAGATIAMGSGLVAGAIGSDLNRRERATALEAEYKALEYTPAGQTVAWGDKSAGRYGEVVAATPYRVGSQDCRQYGHSVTIDGQQKKARGTACRNPDGSWSPLT
ncbi:hypothetical protein GA830_11100 [Mesorhizobium sp. NBSH29]|uniref:hypothetical protein n=1 Tax=Mesorhizobium sp. NBSH29 TaxID=2654249 RepID=UPI0018967FFA|nr:hypothetical protein [Mesorhizobium sp. NBSH29]QPC87226.1 hypothetical protein GA830_11100 [Mesorhizobium sp. NBSH29]